jgi:16S rRNA G527 N7-methylase RsmG
MMLGAGPGAARRASPRRIDVGSGAGFAGLVLAVALPEGEATFVEATGKKARFQEGAVVEIGLPNARVTNGRAEMIRRRATRPSAQKKESGHSNG